MLFIKKLGASHFLSSTNRALSDIEKYAIWVVAAVTSPFAWFLGFVFGGNFGGAVASTISEASGLPSEILISGGVGLGIFACTVLLSIGSVFLIFIVIRLVECVRAFAS